MRKKKQPDVQVTLNEQEVRMLRILLDNLSRDQAKEKEEYLRTTTQPDCVDAMMLDDYNYSEEERFVMQEILDKLGGAYDPFDLATGLDMGYFSKSIQKRMKKKSEESELPVYGWDDDHDENEWLEVAPDGTTWHCANFKRRVKKSDKQG